MFVLNIFCSITLGIESPERSIFVDLREIQSHQNMFIHANDGQNENATSLSSDETKSSDVLAISMPVTVGNLISDDSSYSCSTSVDPFWPLCMYELRGKCNNDECPWQHAKDYGDKNIQHAGSKNEGIKNSDCLKLICLVFILVM